jgi:phosphopantothenoylcysteine decarboxylase/phosphopantothenate--cysteine ligase
MLQGKKIILGVTGSIAAYKSAELTREFVKRGAAVRVIMTRNAAEFINPLTFQTLSGNPVYSDMYSSINHYSLAHISLAEDADIVVIAPATANIIGKIASGLADDLLTATVMTTKAPVLICPAMNTNMYENKIVQENITRLISKGCLFMEPAYGELACSYKGRGRLPESLEIVEEVESTLTIKDLEGEQILVTAGPTREPFDPVRYITNYSSGKMGYALAIAGRRRGANVVLISGPSTLSIPRGITFVSVSTAMEMRDAVMAHLESSTIVVKAAAVADYRPSTVLKSKIKKKNGPLTISLERNPDIIAEIGKKKGNRILVGFAVETENLIESARAKLFDKQMDLIVANDVTQVGAGFGYDTNIIKILDRKGGQLELPMMDKIEAADRILDRIREIVITKKRKKRRSLST